MNNLQWFELFGLALVCLTVVICIGGWRKWGWRGVAYELKFIGEMLKPIVALVVGAYIVVFGLVAVSYIEKWVTSQSPSTELSELFVLGTPVVWLGLVIFMAFWVGRGIVSPFRYNDQEKLWQAEEKEKIRQSRRYKWVSARMPKLARMMWR